LRGATPTAEFIRNPDWQFPLEKHAGTILIGETGRQRADFIDANGSRDGADGRFAIAGNLFLLGHAWQQGLVPVSLAKPCSAPSNSTAWR
jgi:indolepyruvate ferredoxin oxidoreductase